MKKQYAIFWLSTQRNESTDESYHTLGMIMGIFDTEREAELEIEGMEATPNERLTIIPIYKPNH